MERITYRITLDTHRNGIQRTLQGFETADNMSRRIAVNLVASGDTCEFPMDHITAMMYVTTPNATEPSINACTIEGNTVIYDVLPIVEEGITEMQLKVIKGDVNGARSVLAAPKFAVEVTESGANDEGAQQTTTFTALENAMAKANNVYDSRLLRIEIDTDCTFRAIYADGTVYENDSLHEALYNGNALLSESWAKGGTGIRAGEDTNNAKYYSNVSRSASADADMVAEEARAKLDEARLQTSFTAFNVDFESGDLIYASANYGFDVNEETGNLDIDGGENYTPDEVVKDALKNLCTETENAIAQEEADRKAEIAVERARINMLTALEDGSTTGDAELADARVDYQGIIWGNVGEHLRFLGEECFEQIGEVSAELRVFKEEYNVELNSGKYEDSVRDVKINNIESDIVGIKYDVALNSVGIDNLVRDKAVAIKETASGELPLCVKDTANARIKIHSIEGKSEQDGTSGAQLFDASILTKGSNTSLNVAEDGYTITVTGKDAYSSSPADLDISLFAGKTVYLKADSITATASGAIAQLRITHSDGSKKYLPINGSTLSDHIDVPADVSGVRVTVAANNGSTALSSDNTAVFKGLRITLAEDTVWEKYSGGQPSPNPDYPQEIRNVNGKNLLDCRGLTEKVSCGVTFTPVYDAYGNLEYVEANGTNDGSGASVMSIPISLTVGQSYTLSGCPSGGSTTTYHTQIAWFGTDTGSGHTATVTESTAKVVTLIVANGGGTVSGIRFRPMVRKASIKDATYVPYGLLRLKARGKNLADTRNLKVGVANGITFTPKYDSNGDLEYVEANGTNNGTANSVMNIPIKFEIGKSYTMSGCPSGGSTTTYMMQISNFGNLYGGEYTSAPTEKTSKVLHLIVMKGATVSKLRFYPMFREADVEDGTYEPYTENSITLSQPIELNNIGVRGDADILTADSFTPSFKRVIITGEENWTAHTTIVGLWMVSILPYSIAYSYDIKSEMLCTRYTTRTRRDVCDNKLIGIANQNAEAYIYDDTVSTADELKAKFRAWYDAGEPMEIVYRLRDEGITTEPLPTADQIALRSLLSYDGMTYLECDSEVSPTINAEVVLDTKRYIDRKIAEVLSGASGILV